MNRSIHGENPRRFLIFAPSDADERYRRQRSLLQGPGPGLEERDLEIIPLLEKDGDTARAREDAGIDSGDFAAVLIGRDGGVKLRSDEPVTPEDLFQLMDSMPMRRREMRERERD